MVLKGSASSWHAESCQTRDQSYVLCINRWILIHCATREDPPLSLIADNLQLILFWGELHCVFIVVVRLSEQIQ